MANGTVTVDGSNVRCSMDETKGEAHFVAESQRIKMNGSGNCQLNDVPRLQQLYQELLDQCIEQANFFRDDTSEKGQRLHAAFVAWQDFVILAHDLVLKIEDFAWKYDFDSETPGNGYRSFITVTGLCIKYGLGVCTSLYNSRSAIFFRKKFYVKEVEACSQLLSSLCTCLQYLQILHRWSSETGDLFANGEHSAEELFEIGDTINQYCFYGRCLGFQYSDSLRGALRLISISMASFSETFYAEDTDGALMKTTRSVWASGKYLMNPELRAIRIVNISQNAKIDFCKSFWFLSESEFMHKLPSIVGTSIKINRVIEIPAEPLQLPRVSSKANKNQTVATDVNQNDDAELIDIPVPSSHLGSGTSISVRLLSHSRRVGMLGEGKSYGSWRRLQPPSRSILVHFHGGGFVAQSSKSHELYLRDWAVALDVPILSVDYSLAPEAPFPRALEETFYAYCWVLKNAQYLGTTAERIVLAGDSAGANLSIGVTLKCIQSGVRIPDGLFLAYCPTLISFVPSPARLLCLMDPLLPFGFMMRCLRAYASPGQETLDTNAKHLAEIAKIQNMEENNLTLNLNVPLSAATSRRTSTAKTATPSLVESSAWEQMDVNAAVHHLDEGHSPDESSDTFASASDRSHILERTDLMSAEEDNSLCVSFEDDSQPIVHYPVEGAVTFDATPKTDTQQYIDNFLEKYLVETCTEVKENGHMAVNVAPKKCLSPTRAKTASEENLLIDTGKEMIALNSIHGCLNNAVNSISSTLNKYTKSTEIRNSAQQRIANLCNMDALIARSPSVEFMFQVPKDPFLSPYWASDEWLQQLPETMILTLDMDPCLDDCVMFAKKLKNLKRPVKLEILKGLPHGFLNLTMLSSEATKGSKRCIECLQELLKVPDPVKNS